MNPESVSNGDENSGQTSDVSAGGARATPGMELLKDIELPVTLRFGSAQMSLRELVGLNTGAVIELDRALTDQVEILVGGSVIARGEPIVVQGVYGVRVSEITGRQQRLMTTSLQAAVSAGSVE
ncbi:MAG TPA: FliM/FliN family flagellar motor switch protein [Bryobacteraceae bacterium]|jgi:flagellar motor switch protein FliN/FliY|nr:FliM/FliN family flagellar motor switch protein [Bryobacteraceae bacterium]